MSAKTQMTKVNVTTQLQLDDLCNDSAFTIEGFKADDENLTKLLDWIKARTSLKRECVFITKGEVMNRVYHLTRTNRYPNDLNIVSVKLSDMQDCDKLIIDRFAIGGRWFDDIVDNNLRREKEFC